MKGLPARGWKYSSRKIFSVLSESLSMTVLRKSTCGYSRSRIDIQAIKALHLSADAVPRPGIPPALVAPGVVPPGRTGGRRRMISPRLTCAWPASAQLNKMDREILTLRIPLLCFDPICAGWEKICREKSVAYESSHLWSHRHD